MDYYKRDKKDRQGIALVVVLGFLAVLTLLAVGMAISMRTERLASSNYLDMVHARNYVSAGLSDSMVWVEEHLATTTPKDFIAAPCFKGAAAQNWSTFFWMLPSRDPESGGDTFKNSLFDGLGTNFMHYVPIRYQYELPVDADDVEKMGAEWIHIRDDGGDVIGRYMYLVFDTSAFVDLNYLRKEVAPGFTAAGDWDMLQNLDSFLQQRSLDVRYESARDVLDSNPEAASSGPQADWFHFSYFPPMKRIYTVKEDGINKVKFLDDLDIAGLDPGAKVPLPRDISDIRSKRVELTAAFKALIDVADSRVKSWVDFDGSADENDLYELLVDFVDDGFTPEGDNFDRASIKPVPMVNEVMISGNIAKVEVWMPFVGPEASRFTGTFKIEVDADGKRGSLDAQLPDWTSDVRPPLPKAFEVELSSDVTNTTFDVEIVISSSEGDLDKVRLSGVELEKYWQCNDPRFNHLPSQWAKNSNTGTMNAINSNARFRRNINNSGRLPSGDTYLFDGDYMMYCANQPLNSPGDLGYLPVAPWRTLKLYEDWDLLTFDGMTMDPVLDYFTMQTNVAYGKLNPNAGSHYGRTVDAILDTKDQAGGGYLSMYESEPNLDDRFLFKNVMDQDEEGVGSHKFARNLMVTFRRDGQPDQGFPSINLSTFGARMFMFNYPGNHSIGNNKDLLANFKNNSASDPQYSELRLQHLMRRASMLANVRQNLFLVTIWAQNLGEPTGGPSDWDTYPIKAEAQAVALVWRDPYPVDDDNQYHPKFVRYMRWME